jgi:ribosome-binding protein aMBF1 (putative translation factor)
MSGDMGYRIGRGYGGGHVAAPRRAPLSPAPLTRATPLGRPCKPTSDAFGARLRTKRRALGMTQPDLAALVHCSAVCLSYWEHGKRRPNMDTIERLAMALGVSASWLAYGL